MLSCPVCEAEKNIEVVDKSLKITVRNHVLDVITKLRKCSNCGEEFIIPDIDENPLEVAYRKYRKLHSFLQPEEIKAFRETYHLTQAELNKLLGLGTATISRYENGRLQDEACDKLIKLAMDCGNLRKLVIGSDDVFSEKKKKKVLAAIDKGTAQMTDCFKQFITTNFEDSSPDEYRGFKKFDFGKFVNAILYFCKGGVVKTKLNKLLFYADFLYFKEYSVSITGAQYARVPFGPAPNNFDLYYSLLSRQEKINIEEIQRSEYPGEKYVSNAEPDLSNFSDGELKILATVSERFKSYRAIDITQRSHTEKGYIETENGKLISYLYSQHVNLGEATRCKAR